MGGACSGSDHRPTDDELAVETIPKKVKVLPDPPIGPAPKFTVTLVGARGLRNADWLPGTNKSDAYLELKTGTKLHHRTEVISDCLEPVWREECRIMELQDKAPLEFHVFDEDIASSEKLGKVVLKREDFEEGFVGELELRDTGKKAHEEKAYVKIKIKAGHKDYPPGPPPEISISAERKAKGTAFGLDLDVQNGMTLYVMAVKDGPFKECNRRRAPEAQLTKGDFIVRVNGVAGSTDKMLDEFRSELKVEVVVRRNDYFVIDFEKDDPKEPLGLQVPSKPQGELLAIREIVGGAAARHNKGAEWDKRLRAGDHIASVGGARGQATDLLGRLGRLAGGCQLVVERPASTGADDWLFE